MPTATQGSIVMYITMVFYACSHKNTGNLNSLLKVHNRGQVKVPTCENPIFFLSIPTGFLWDPTILVSIPVAIQWNLWDSYHADLHVVL